MLAGAVVAVGSLATPFVFPTVSRGQQPGQSGRPGGPQPDHRPRRRPASPRCRARAAVHDQQRRHRSICGSPLSTTSTAGSGHRRRCSRAARSNVADFPAAIGSRRRGRTHDEQRLGDGRRHPGRWLPVPYPTTKVTGLKGNDWYADDEGLSVRSTTRACAARLHGVRFLDPEPHARSAGERRNAPAYTCGSRYLEVPGDTPAIIAQTAGRWPAGGEQLRPRPRAADLLPQRRSPTRRHPGGRGLRRHGRRHRRRVPAEEGRILRPFRVGDGDHGAHARHPVARRGRLPAGAVDLQPRQRRSRSTSHDLHAWPELYFQGIGWLRFEPTPGAVTCRATGGAAVGDSTIDPSATPTATPTATPRRATRSPTTTTLPTAIRSECGNGHRRSPIIGGIRSAAHPASPSPRPRSASARASAGGCGCAARAAAAAAGLGGAARHRAGSRVGGSRHRDPAGVRRTARRGAGR